MTPEQIKIAMQIGIFLVVFGAGWIIKGWKDDVAYTELLMKHTEEANARITAEQTATANAIAERDRLQTKLTEADKRYYHDLTEARKNYDKRVSDITNDRVRLTVPARCPGGTPGTANVGDGTTERAVVDSNVGRDIYAVGQYCDEQVTKLRALQNYVQALDAK